MARPRGVTRSPPLVGTGRGTMSLKPVLQPGAALPAANSGALFQTGVPDSGGF